MTTSPPVVLGIAGVGGYAGSIADLVLAQGPRTAPTVQLAAVCDPSADRFPERIQMLRDRGVRVLASYDELLAVKAIEGVWLPLPIDLHRPFTERALAAGKAVMCEKPAAGSVDDVDAMIAARDRAALPVAIGYQDIYDPSTLALKRRLLSGELGQVRRAVVHACWPRDSGYFGRANWAGRLKRDGTWVLDSPAQNALSHYINLPLFLLGAEEADSATPTAVEAELYRANPIENYDTISMRVELAGGAQLLVLFTHACEQTHGPIVTIECERGSAVRTSTDLTVRTRDGAEQQELPHAKRHHSMLQRFARLVRGQADPDVAVASLEVARAHTVVVNGASEAAPIRTVPEEAIRVLDVEQGTLTAITDIEATITACAAAHQTLHASHRLPFTYPPQRRDLSTYAHFAGPHELVDV